MNLQFAYSKLASVALVLLVTVLLISFLAIPGLLPSDNAKTQALAQLQQNNVEQGSEGSNNIATVASFNASEGQLPEGAAIMSNNNKVFVSFAPLIQVVYVNENLTVVSNATTIQNQKDTLFTATGSWPAIPQNKGYMTGLAFDVQENLYAAIASQTPEVVSGVYRIEPNGGNATLFATHPKMQFPNALVFDERGQLYISDSGAGTIFLAQPLVQPNSATTVTEWLSHPLLQGNSTFCPHAPDLQMNIGANGIVLDRSKTSLFVANTDRASILRVPIGLNGSPGEPEVFVGPECENLAGADGMVIDERANELIIAANKLDKIVRVSIDNRTTSTLASGGVLDFPAGLAIKEGMDGLGNSSGDFGRAGPDSNATEQKDRTLYITNFAFLSSQQNPGESNPALLSMQLDNAAEVVRQNQTAD